MKLGLAAALICLAVSSVPGHAQTADPQNTIRMETSKGMVTIALRPDLAPKHAERIKTLVRDKFYDNVPFHRVIEGFMAQTGDGEKGNGTGKSKYPNIASEFTPTQFKRGVIGMARASDPNSANSQFFIVLADAPHLNNQYTVIGQVVSGMEVVDKLKRGEPVRDPDKIVRMQIAADAR